MGNKWLRNVVGGLIAVGLMAGSGHSGSAGVTNDDLTPAEVALARMIAFGVVDTEGLTFVPVTDPHDDQPGDPNPLLCTGAETYQVDGTIDSETFSLSSFADSIRVISPGDPTYFVNQLAFTLVVACLRTSPVLTDAALSEVSVAWYLFGQEILEAGRFAVDPELGMNSVFSHASVDGQEMNGFTFLNGGAFFPGEIPIPVMSFWLSGQFYLAAFLPGRPEAIRVKSADAGEASLDALKVQMADVEAAPEIAQLADPEVGQSAQAVADDLRAEMSAEPPQSAVPTTTATSTTSSMPIDDEPNDQSQPVDPGTDEPVAVAAPVEETEVATSSTAATTTTEPAEGESSGGSSSWLKILLGASLFAVLVAFIAWMLRRRSAPSSEDDTTGRSGAPAAPGSPPSAPSTPEGPVVEEGGLTNAPPIVPGAPPAPLVRCDWELWLDQRRLKQAAPGHLVCCVYRVEIESIEAIPERGVFFAGDSADRVRIPGFRMAGAGLGFSAEAMTRTQPDDGSRGEDASEILTTVPQRIALGAPNGLPPDIAAHLECGETTAVTVTLESKCRDHRHEYRGTAESHIDLSAGGSCSNTDPGDRCDVWLRSVADGEAGVSGDLDVDVGSGVDLGGDELDVEAALGSDPHDHRGDGEPVVTDSDTGAGGLAIKPGFVWSATFHNGFTLDAAQIAPSSVRETTDDVETRALGAARHTLSLEGETMTRSCLGRACGCGATGCTCEPSFKLAINADTQELTADVDRWTLSRDSGGSGRWTAS